MKLVKIISDEENYYAFKKFNVVLTLLWIFTIIVLPLLFIYLSWGAIALIEFVVATIFLIAAGDSRFFSFEKISKEDEKNYADEIYELEKEDNEYE